MLDVAAVFLLGTAASYLLLRWLLERIFFSRHATPVFAERSEQPNLLDWILDRDDWLVLNLATTSLDRRAEIIEIAVLGANGRILLNELVMPKSKIRRSATAVHGIDRMALEGRPTWPHLLPSLSQLIAGRPIIAYDVEFAKRAVGRTCRKWRLKPLHLEGHCAMLAYARHRAVPDGRRREDFKRHGLAEACRHEGLAANQHHRALADARLTRALILKAATERQQIHEPQGSRLVV